MLQIGKNISDSKDKLEVIQLKQLMHLIKNTPLEIKELINRAYDIRHIDKNKFIDSLSMIPYFTFSIYNPPYKIKENFGCIHYFPFLLKHSRHIYKKIKKNDEIHCAFKIIEDDKIMIILKLNKPIYDRVIFEEVYNNYIEKFVYIHFMEFIENFYKVKIDDCFFLNHDKDFYYNENSKLINTEELINNIEINKLNIHKKEEFKEPTTNNDITEEIIKAIREKIGIREKLNKSEKYYENYKKLEIKKETIIEKLKNEGIDTIEIFKIFRGEKIRMQNQDNKWGEINIFVTDKGYKITEALKNGMDKDIIQKAKIILTQELILR